MASTRWTCPDCRRVFGGVGRSHVCSPGLSLDEFLKGQTPDTDAIVRRVIAHLKDIDDGSLIVDPVDALVLLKNGPMFANIRIMKKWTALGFNLKRRVVSPRFSRKVQEHPGGYFHVLNLTTADEIDDEVCDWLAESFLGEEPDDDDFGGDMVPDDVDIFIEPPR